MNISETSSVSSRRRRWRILIWSAAALIASMALLASALFAALTTEAGARSAWRLARAFTGGRLSGALEGGTLAGGIRMRALRWRDGEADICIDRLDGQWRLTRAPLRLTVYFLRIGAVDAHLPPSTDEEKAALPESLKLPLALDIRDAQMERLRLHRGASSTEFSGLKLRATSDGQRHQIHLDSFETPFGMLTAQATLDGRRPFAVSGAAHFSGKIQEEAVQLDARLSGSLEQLIAEVEAAGLKLSARARIHATPFAETPFKTLTLSAEHLNPRAFSERAPQADLALRAQLAPLLHHARKTDAGLEHFSVRLHKERARRQYGDRCGRSRSPSYSDGGDPAAIPNTEHAEATQGKPLKNALVIAGPLSITNAQPGPLHQQRLPLIDLHAEAQLDAQTQTFPNLRIRLVQGAQIEGGGGFSNENGQWKGRFDLRARALNLNVFARALRKTQLSGPITIAAHKGAQRITAELADAQAALRAQMKITLDAQRIALNAFRLQAGKGRAEVSGALRKDAHSGYQLNAAFSSFAPFALLQKPPQTHPARISGAFNAKGQLTPALETRLSFALRDSVYASFPLTGEGMIHLLGKRLLPSKADLSIAGNRIALRGSLGRPNDTLRFEINAPQLGQIGFGLAGALKAGGTLSGAFTRPAVSARYQANALVFQKNRIGQLEGRVEWHGAARGALAFSADGRDIHLPNLSLRTLHAKLEGARAQHALTLNTAGRLLNQPLELQMSARGGLTETRAGMGWAGTLSQLESRGWIAAQLKAPMTVRAGPHMLILGAAQLAIEDAQLDLRMLDMQRGRLRSAGALKGLEIARLLQIQERLTGKKPELNTTLVLDGHWDFALSESAATGAIQLERRLGDVQLHQAPAGFSALSARLDLSNQKQASLSVHAQAARLGTLEANMQTRLAFANGYPALAAHAPLNGAINAEMPALKNIGILLGPQTLLDGRSALRLAVSGSVAQPKFSGALNGEGLSITWIDQGVTLKNGVVRIAIANNRADFQKVEFQGASGALRATGSVTLDRADTPLSVQIVADALELFARPDRQLSISGRATMANRSGSAGGFAIDGDFTVHRAFFNLPSSPAPKLGEDVVIVRADDPYRSAALESLRSKDAPPKIHLFQTRVGIDLGKDFRFRGAGADLDLVGKITLSNAAGAPLRAHGDLRARRGSTYEILSVKLDVEKGYVSFNGPVDNPALNILAMRRNQEVEVGLQVRGTTRAPRAQLVSEPNVPDTEKLSWLLFRHGTDKGATVGQQYAKNAALAFLGSMGGKQIAQRIGLDELSISQSEIGLTDPQVITLAKALNRHFILGYEEGLSSSAHIFKVTWQFWRSWSIIAHTGTVNGVNLLFSRRFD